MSAPSAQAYLAAIRHEIPRVLSWQDREPFSKTCGCFDRTYWCWKFTDFPGARFQEGVYVLAHLFCHSFEGNALAGNELALDWALAGMRFWQRIQHRDGSFDEAYPNEHSLAAVAFTSFYVAEAFLLLEDHIDQAGKSGIRDALSRAGRWLCNNDERHGILTNHLAAAAAALHVTHRITGEDEFHKRSQFFLDQIYSHQSKEGWYEEYGGADPGYQTHATFYLARLWQHTRDAALLGSLKSSTAFLKYFVHPNGTLGGEYGSRNTEFYFPAGFEILAPVDADAALMARFMRPSIADGTAAGLATIDAQNLLPMLNNYLFASQHASNLETLEGSLPCQRQGEMYFPDAGLYTKATGAYYAVLGLSKGGVLKTHDRRTGSLTGSDCGYWARLADGRVVSSQSLNRQRSWRVQGAELTIESPFVEVVRRTPSPWLFVAFRLVSLSFGRLQTFAYLLKGLLVRALVRNRRELPLRLVRQIRLEADGVSVMDTIQLAAKLKVTSLYPGAKFATVHMGSSRYFQPQELDVPYSPERNLADDLMRDRVVRIERRLASPHPAGAEAS